MRVLFAEQGTKGQLLNTLRQTEGHAVEMQRFGIAIAREYEHDGGAFPDRLHVNALIFEFMWRYSEAIKGWAQWAIDEVENWTASAHSPGEGMSCCARTRRWQRRRQRSNPANDSANANSDLSSRGAAVPRGKLSRVVDWIFGGGVLPGIKVG